MFQNISNLIKNKGLGENIVNIENSKSETFSSNEGFINFENQEEIPQNGLFSFLENKLTFLNNVILFFFNPLMNMTNNNSSNILEKTPFFKKTQLIIILFLFSYLVYYIFGFFIDIKNNYCSSSFWLWIIMFLIIYLTQPL